MSKYVEPAHLEKSFTCPHCNVLAQQHWVVVGYHQVFGGVAPDHLHDTCVCLHCNQESLWVNEEMVYPRIRIGPEPNPDLNEDIRGDYEEARRIASDSPRGAAALLRLCVQKLCAQIGEEGKNIDDDIAALVKKGLPVKIQQALDIVRVIGNESVHPGTIDVRDDPNVVASLFELVNMICENQISEPKKTEKLFNSLPPNKLKGISERDKRK